MKITESQLRRVVRKIVNEQAAAPSAVPTIDPNSIPRGNTYGHTDVGVEYADENMSDEEAVESLRARFAGAPLWKFVVGKDPNMGGKVFAYYEIDTSN